MTNILCVGFNHNYVSHKYFIWTKQPKESSIFIFKC